MILKINWHLVSWENLVGEQDVLSDNLLQVADVNML